MSYIQTITGRKIDFKAPDPNEIHIFDIATGLARAPRFAGHTRGSWTVAMHSVFVADHCPPDLKLAGLLHDASEAYTGDLPAPLKHLLVEFCEIETNLQVTIANRYDVQWYSRVVHKVDRWALEEERRVYCPMSTWRAEEVTGIENTWPYFGHPTQFRQARYSFLTLFSRLCSYSQRKEAAEALDWHNGGMYD